MRRPSLADPGTFVRLLVPNFLIALGAGQVIPYLNVFIEGRFGLDLTALNFIFAIAGLGTVLAMMAQPALARRFGKVGTVVLVQGLSIPFLLVLGFSPILWTVIVAMTVRTSLMNAGHPLANAFAMEQLRPSERATYAAAASLLWSFAWAVAGPWYSLLQANLGFDGRHPDLYPGGLGVVGPMGSYGALPAASRLLLTFAILAENSYEIMIDFFSAMPGLDRPTDAPPMDFESIDIDCDVIHRRAAARKGGDHDRLYD